MLVLHLGARAVSGAVLALVARTQAANPWTEAAPSYLAYAGLMWDASWYRAIAESGYPAELPLGPDGGVQQNGWAFFPLFPVLARGVMGLTGGSWHVVAPTLALVLGTAAMLVVHQVVAAAVSPDGIPATGPQRALPLATVAVLTTSAAAPVLQVGYTESLALLLLAGVLLCVLRRRYLVALPLVLALGLTRAVALPLVVVALVHGWQRWRAAREDVEPFPGRDRVGVALLAATAALSGLLWPAVCALVTGVPDGYTRTQAAWRGSGQVVPLVPWYEVAVWLLGGWGVVVLVAVVALAVVVVRSRSMRRLGPELQAWTAGYLGYLLVVLEPGTSLVRFLLLAFPLAGVLAGPAVRSRHPRTAVVLLVLLGTVAQVAWVSLLWRLVPPSGWPP
ncbi:MAG: hypothetical protein JWP95_98 [Actinotalea sp.]|nr:hypothetical protein [Actinotalea sp.]